MDMDQRQSRVRLGLTTVPYVTNPAVYLPSEVSVQTKTPAHAVHPGIEEESLASCIQLTETVKIEPDAQWLKLEDARADAGWACDNCDLPFPTYDSLTAHVGSCLCHSQPGDLSGSEEFPPSPEAWELPDPDTKILTRYSHLNLKRPKLCLERVRAFTCSSCPKTFAQESALRRHELDCSRFKCGFCTAVLKSRQGLRVHCWSLHCVTGEAFPCNLCSKLFKGPSFLAKHQQATHSGRSQSSATDPTRISAVLPAPITPASLQSGTENGPPYQCQSCGLSFEGKRSYQKHVATHPRPRHPCTQCGLEFEHNLDLMDHYSTDHPATGTDELEEGEMLPEEFVSYASPQVKSIVEQVPHQCTRCALRFESLAMFREHFLKDHIALAQPRPVTIEMPLKSGLASLVTYKSELELYCCPFCPRSCKDLPDLATHVRFHYLPFQCPDCWWSFSDRSLFREHVSDSHQRRDSVIYCPYCGRPFSNPSAFDQHFRAHDESVKYAPPPSFHKFTRIILLNAKTGKDRAEQMSSEAHYSVSNVCSGTEARFDYLAVSHLEFKITADSALVSRSKEHQMFREALNALLGMKAGGCEESSVSVSNIYVEPTMPAMKGPQHANPTVRKREPSMAPMKNPEPPKPTGSKGPIVKNRLPPNRAVVQLMGLVKKAKPSILQSPRLPQTFDASSAGTWYYQCKTCPAKFDTFELLREHFRNNHPLVLVHQNSPTFRSPGINTEPTISMSTMELQHSNPTVENSERPMATVKNCQPSVPTMKKPNPKPTMPTVDKPQPEPPVLIVENTQHPMPTAKSPQPQPTKRSVKNPESSIQTVKVAQPQPFMPMPRLINPQYRPSMPMTRLINPQSRPSMPMTRLINPQSRPSMPMPMLINPQSRPSMPMPRLINPQSRPSMPMTRLINPQSRPSMPMTRLINPQSRPSMLSIEILQPLPSMPMRTVTNPQSRLYLVPISLQEPAVKKAYAETGSDVPTVVLTQPSDLPDCAIETTGEPANHFTIQPNYILPTATTSNVSRNPVPPGSLTFPSGTFRLEGVPTSYMGSGPLKITKFKCAMCGLKFDQLDLLCSHVRDAHVLPQPQGTEFPSVPTTVEVNGINPAPSLGPILEGPVRKVAFDCQICGQGFTRLSKVYGHLKSVHSTGVGAVTKHVQVRERSEGSGERPDSPKPFQCELCKEGFLLVGSLVRHFRSAHPGSGLPKPFHCFICNTSFERRPERLQHFDLHHTGGSMYQCRLCVSEFSDQTALIFHLKEAHPKRYACSFCSCNFAQKSMLQNHLKRSHEKQQLDAAASAKLIKPCSKLLFKCKFCYEGFKSPEESDGHEEIFHLSSRPGPDWPVDSQNVPRLGIIGMTGKFVPIQELTELRAPVPAEKTPGQQVAFNCKICDTQYSRLQEMYEHLDTNHDSPSIKEAFVQVREWNGAARPFGQIFEEEAQVQQKTDFQNQTLYQYNTKPFACLICERVYPEKESLFWHLDRIHTEGGQFRRRTNEHQNQAL